jgi:hypothetical protein
MHVYHSRWHELSDQHIENLFKKYLGATTVSPFALLPKLRKLEVATLELIEDRTQSTVYRIRETGQTYTLPAMLQDEPKTLYKNKPPVFIIRESENSCQIERIKPPRFTANYDLETKELFNITWLDAEPILTSLNSTLKKAALFLRDNVK